jgi:NAD(P)-dependent dehydrogenase (short-subunit alcohol dehydrogenase family)
MNAAAAREGNALRREELKLKVQEARNALDDKIRTKQADVESAAGTIDNLINTVDRLKKNPSLDDVVGSIEGRMPAVFGDENADAVALIETLGSQTFLAQIPAMKGLGALSEKEGDKLQSSLQNLSRAQSERQFRANLDEVQRLMLKARKNVETRYGIKAGPPDTPAVQTPAADIDALVNKYLNPQPPGAR